MSFNILNSNYASSQGDMDWSQRHDRVRSVLQQESPDLIGFQEVSSRQLSDLIEDLPEFDNFRMLEYAIFYRRDRYSQLDSGSFWSSCTDTVWLKLHDRIADQAFVMTNSHPCASGCTADDGENELTAEVIQQEIAEISSGLPVVLTGDMNFQPWTPCYDILTGKTGPQNVTLNDSCDPWCEDEYTIGIGRIDYVLHTNDIQTMDAQVVTTLIDGLRPSDHRPVTADLLFTDARLSFPLTFSRPPSAIYTVIDDDFDDVGDRTSDRLLKPAGGVGESDTETNNAVGRLVVKFRLPPYAQQVTPEVESAVLRFFLEDTGGTPAGPVSVFHSTTDNDLDTLAYFLASDYEDADYIDTERDLVDPTSKWGRYYELDVTDWVLDDWASDSGDLVSAFRLQINEAEFLEDDQSRRYRFTMPGAETNGPELVLTFVPEPSASVLALFALGLLCWRRRGP